MSSREHTGISRGWALANQFSSKSFNHIFHFIFPKAVRTHFKQVDMWDYLRIIKRRLAPDYCGIRVKSLPFLDKSREIQPCLFFFCCLSLSCWRHGNVSRLQTHLKLSNFWILSSGIYIPPTFLLIRSIKGVIQPTAPVSELYGRYTLLPLTWAHVLWTEWGFYTSKRALLSSWPWWSNGCSLSSLGSHVKIEDLLLHHMQTLKGWHHTQWETGRSFCVPVNLRRLIPRWTLDLWVETADTDVVVSISHWRTCCLRRITPKSRSFILFGDLNLWVRVWWRTFSHGSLMQLQVLTQRPLQIHFPGSPPNKRLSVIPLCLCKNYTVVRTQSFHSLSAERQLNSWRGECRRTITDDLHADTGWGII